MKFRWFLQVLVLVSLLGFAPPPARQDSRPIIRGVRILTPNVARFDRFELRFDLLTRADHLNLPYDPNPPAEMENISGVSADAIFTSPSGIIYTQPAFLYQPYHYQNFNGQDHRIPAGVPYWLVRFTPQEEGPWQVRLRATDAGGMSLSPGGEALTFTVRGISPNAYRQHGFLRVSPTDRRYFEFQDGTPFIAAGFNTGMGSQAGAAVQMADYEQNKINFIRTWLSGEGINGSQWTPWASTTLGYDGYLPGVSLETRQVYPGHDLAFRLDAQNPCLFQGWQQGPVAVEAGKSYILTARIKLVDVRAAGTAGGFVVKTGGWSDKQCAQAGAGVAVTQPAQGSRDWFEVSGKIIPGGNFLDNLYLALQDTSAGTALIDEVRLYRADDPSQTNPLRQGSADSHLNFDPIGADKWDSVIDKAEQHGVYLKLVIDEKNEWIRNRIGPDGKFTDQPDNNLFYATEGSKGRWLQQAWWRYVIARWGYSPAIHSFEYINEGDPYNGNHYQAAAAMARYFHRYDPSHHLVTTSFWAAFPNAEFWSNPAYAEIDYADLHAYISTGWEGGNAGFTGRIAVDQQPASARGAAPSIRIDGSTAGSYTISPRGLVLREKGEWIVRYWMKTEGFSARCPYNSSGGMQRVRWLLDGGRANGGSEGVVPGNSEGKDFICTSPVGTFDWRLLRSDQDREGRTLPAQQRLIITDDRPHEISLSIENYDSSGRAWISQIELVSPSGQVTPVIGQFDPTTFEEDTAWYNAAYGLLLGGASPVGAHKPLVRGEGGLDDAEQGGWLAAINQDKQGIWLHNNLWAQVGPGGIPDLMWWASETIEENPQTGRVPGLLEVFAPYRNFMDGIPLTNGQYHDARAQVSDPRLRAWGQSDNQNGRAHLWIQNRQHTWKAVVEKKPVSKITGTITLPDFPAGIYTVEWWDTYQAENAVIKTEQVSAAGGKLVLTLPQPLLTDIAVKIFQNKLP